MVFPRKCFPALVILCFLANAAMVHLEEEAGLGKTCGNPTNKYTIQELTDEELFSRGHLKPFGSHRPPDEIVEELPFMISPEDFYMKYVIRHKPVVLKGAAKHWPAYKLWSDEYLNETYGNVTFHMETRDDDKFNLPKDMKLKRFLEVYQEANRYLVDEVPPSMRKEIILPLCLRCEEMDRYFFVSFFWFSQGNTSSKIHIDTDENVLCVVKGHKEVLLISPEYSGELYADSSRILGVSDIDVFSVDMIKYPRAKNVHYLKAVVDEGDMVYIPQMWWHQVYSRPGRQQAVALWWKSKPWLRDGGRKSIPWPLPKDQDMKEMKYSYAYVLAQYEQWVQNVSSERPMIACKEQNVLMSNYLFETDKDPDAKTTLGDGGDLEEESEVLYQEKLNQAKLSDKDEQQKYSSFELPCDFDRENLKCPCYYKSCKDDYAVFKCIRYILDYCAAFQDRGCVIQLPHLLNKLGEDDYSIVKTLPTDFS